VSVATPNVTYGSVAQSVEQLPLKQLVAGSSPARSTRKSQ
jgi:hypothetical protein